eukprot:gb/GFBE01032475.1/.p1 GENE.gb/GFBE01032475.1/~~gb/GFBE01032475.1/.p1  ORF type:complete len:471 (+),score=70.71 gb/GFBE01032475.1/:1-1413(+)
MFKMFRFDCDGWPPIARRFLAMAVRSSMTLGSGRRQLPPCPTEPPPLDMAWDKNFSDDQALVSLQCSATRKQRASNCSRFPRAPPGCRQYLGSLWMWDDCPTPVCAETLLSRSGSWQLQEPPMSADEEEKAWAEVLAVKEREREALWQLNDVQFPHACEARPTGEPLDFDMPSQGSAWTVLPSCVIFDAQLDLAMFSELASGGFCRRGDGSKDSAESSLPAHWTCSICLDDCEDLQKTRRLACGHGFHLQCLLLWLCKKQSCPNCRRRVRDHISMENPPMRFDLVGSAWAVSPILPEICVDRSVASSPCAVNKRRLRRLSQRFCKGDPTRFPDPRFFQEVAADDRMLGQAAVAEKWQRYRAEDLQRRAQLEEEGAKFVTWPSNGKWPTAPETCAQRLAMDRRMRLREEERWVLLQDPGLCLERVTARIKSRAHHFRIDRWFERQSKAWYVRAHRWTCVYNRIYSSCYVML